MQTATKLNIAENPNQPFAYGFFFLVSFLVWLFATGVMRLWGQSFFIPHSNLSMIASFLFSLICLPPLAYGLFQATKLQPDQYQVAAICLAIPGMLLDVVTTYFFSQVYPNILPAADGPYGAWLLWGYAIVLITGLAASQWSPGTLRALSQ